MIYISNQSNIGISVVLTLNKCIQMDGAENQERSSTNHNPKSYKLGHCHMGSSKGKAPAHIPNVRFVTCIDGVKSEDSVRLLCYVR